MGVKMLKMAIFFKLIVEIKKKTFIPYVFISMTSLLPHTVAQPTKWRFLPKNLSQLVIFVIELAFT